MEHPLKRLVQSWDDLLCCNDLEGHPDLVGRPVPSWDDLLCCDDLEGHPDLVERPERQVQYWDAVQCWVDLVGLGRWVAPRQRPQLH